jgi:signal transduction histidine kinase
MARQAAASGDVERLVLAYANDGEMAIAVARVVLLLALAARFAFARPLAFGDTGVHVAQRLAGSVVGIAGSVWIVLLARRRRLRLGAHLACAAFDATLCFLGLRADVLWASGSYLGILRMPDIAFLSVLVFGSALRLYGTAVAAAVVLSTASLAWIVRLDRAVHGDRIGYLAKDVQVIALQLAAASAAALVAAWIARRALRHLAAEAGRATRGRRHLHEVLREHHDVRTLLSAARLHLGFLRRDRHSETGGDAEARLDAVERAVEEVGDLLDGIKTRTFGELAVADDIAVVDPASILEGAVSVARERFPDTVVRAALPDSLPTVLLFGGDRALAHVVVNLLVNACEGDGGRRARHVDLRVTAERRPRSRLLFEIIDDGPGFPPDLLERPLNGGLTTKRHGSGLGLSLIAAILEPSGGTIRVQNASGQGARVSVWLPCAR